MIYAAPNTTENSFLDEAPTGLAGTLTWKLLDADGAVVIASATAGITEIEPTVYRKQFTVPDAAGDYVIVWTNGATRITEELVVAYSAAALAAPSGFDLTTVAAVREFMQRRPDDTDQDTVIQREITRVSGHIIGRYGRFRPTETGTKRFVLSNGNELARLPLSPYFLRSLTAISWGADQTTPTALATTDYQLRPPSPIDDVYRWIRFPAYRTVPGAEITVDVTGDWGFTTVPVDVEDACLIAVADRIKREMNAFAAGAIEDDQAAPNRHVALPRAARILLTRYDQQGQG